MSRVQLIAHRGASGHAPENTMAAFKLALEMGAKAIELDVHLSRDGELVVIHDEDLKRVAGRKTRVGQLPAKELAHTDVGSWFHKRFSGEGVPRLEDVFELCDGKAELHVELKKGSKLYPGIEDKVCRLIERRKAWDTTLVSSFDHAALRKVRSLDRLVRLGYLLGLTPTAKAYPEMSELDAESLNCSLWQADAAKVRACRKRGLRVLVYTVNTAAQLAKLAKLGVDGVFTNFPEIKPS
jgi:glycerophosphoryl diester phosphodiesterase